MSISLLYTLVPLFVAWCAQTLKIAIDFYQTRKISVSAIFSSWGFPSTHATMTSSAIMTVYMWQGYDTPLLCVVIVFSILIRYDAINVRFQSGIHAHYINTIRNEIVGILAVPDHTRLMQLKERIGHTPIEMIAWVIFGGSISRILMHNMTYIYTWYFYFFGSIW
jgi:acid phosphatase family membrane protein YuiD